MRKTPLFTTIIPLEHFEAALNHLPGTHSAELDAEQIDATTDSDISVDEPSLDEVTCAIRKLRNGVQPALM